jgi:hypothetical protein
MSAGPQRFARADSNGTCVARLRDMRVESTKRGILALLLCGVSGVACGVADPREALSGASQDETAEAGAAKPQPSWCNDTWASLVLSACDQKGGATFNCQQINCLASLGKAPAVLCSSDVFLPACICGPDDEAEKARKLDSTRLTSAADDPLWDCDLEEDAGLPPMIPPPLWWWCSAADPAPFSQVALCCNIYCESPNDCNEYDNCECGNGGMGFPPPSPDDCDPPPPPPPPNPPGDSGAADGAHEAGRDGGG